MLLVKSFCSEILLCAALSCDTMCTIRHPPNTIQRHRTQTGSTRFKPGTTALKPNTPFMQTNFSQAYLFGVNFYETLYPVEVASDTVDRTANCSFILSTVVC